MVPHGLIFRFFLPGMLRTCERQSFFPAVVV
jgi:hypothetical protein